MNRNHLCKYGLLIGVALCACNETKFNPEGGSTPVPIPGGHSRTDNSVGPASGDVAITNVRIFTGDAVIPRGTVVVSGGKIAAVGKNVSIGKVMHVIDGTGQTLLPGLIDAHVHIKHVEELEEYAVFGVTTVLDMFMAPAETEGHPTGQSRWTGQNLGRCPLSWPTCDGAEGTWHAIRSSRGYHRRSVPGGRYC